MKREPNAAAEPSQNKWFLSTFVFKMEDFKATVDHAFKLSEILARKSCINAKYLKLIMLEAYKPMHWLKIFSSLNFPMAEPIFERQTAAPSSGGRRASVLEAFWDAHLCSLEQQLLSLAGQDLFPLAIGLRGAVAPLAALDSSEPAGGTLPVCRMRLFWVTRWFFGCVLVGGLQGSVFAVWGFFPPVFFS